MVTIRKTAVPSVVTSHGRLTRNFDVTRMVSAHETYLAPGSEP